MEIKVFNNNVEKALKIAKKKLAAAVLRKAERQKEIQAA
jgi:ribosomal protein S21